MKKYIKLKEIATIKLSILEKSSNARIACVTSANLLENNMISGMEFEELIKDDNFLLQKGDILIKRVKPMYVNYIDKVEQDIYISNNLFLVRVVREFSPSYVAYVLNEFVQNSLQKETSGAIVSAINRKLLDDIAIALLPLEIQETIGKAWLASIEKMKLTKKIAELEYTKEIELIKQYTFGDK